ncbi:response regulator [Candidatus Woesebacteria bacterium]|jgi:CheY-like chemotaxis protein|nr:response regulator [Candidatus Woesebacteria bacterium]
MSAKQKILIVEDDQYIRELYEGVLIDAGYEVDTANDGQEGLVKLADSTFDLTLLDVMMPNLDGIGVLKELHAMHEKKLPCKIILLTNLAHDAVIDEALSLGASGYLTKSELNPDEFLEQVKKNLS